MATEDKHPHVTEKESLRVAEAARQTEWERPSFMRELFLGRFRSELLHPYPLAGPERPEPQPGVEGPALSERSRRRESKGPILLRGETCTT